MQNGNLFLVTLTLSSDAPAAMVQQVTDIGPKKVEPRLTDSQKFIRDEESKLLEAVREQRDKKKKSDAEDAQRLAMPRIVGCSPS